MYIYIYIYILYIYIYIYIYIIYIYIYICIYVYILQTGQLGYNRIYIGNHIYIQGLLNPVISSPNMEGAN